MTTVQSPNLNVRLLPWLGHTFEIHWSSTVAHANGRLKQSAQRRSIVLSLNLSSPQQASVQAWVESTHQRSFICARQSMRIVTLLEDGMLHIDVFEPHNDAPMASLTLGVDHTDRPARLLYARTALLERAGLRAGGFDPPTLKS